MLLNIRSEEKKNKAKGREGRDCKDEKDNNPSGSWSFQLQTNTSMAQESKYIIMAGGKDAELTKEDVRFFHL